MAKQFLSDEVIEHIQQGYYATHEQDLTEEQVHALSDEQLRYYNKQANEYKEEKKQKKKLILYIVGAVAFVIVMLLMFLVLAAKSDSNLYDENAKSSSVTTDATGSLGTPADNSTAGAKDSAKQ